MKTSRATRRAPVLRPTNVFRLTSAPLFGSALPISQPERPPTTYILSSLPQITVEGVVSRGEISDDLAADIRGLSRCKKYFAAYNYSEGST
jgi:hypothetical protein